MSASSLDFFFGEVLVGMADCGPLSDGGSPRTRRIREKTWLWNSCRQQLLGCAIVWSSLWLHIHTQSAKFFLRAVSLVVIYSYQTPPPTWPLLYQSWERQAQDKMWRIRPITWRMGKEEGKKRVQVQLKHFPFKRRPKSKLVWFVLAVHIVGKTRLQVKTVHLETKMLWKKVWKERQKNNKKN